MRAPADDDAWMRDGAGELERELTQRQAELDAHGGGAGSRKKKGSGDASSAAAAGEEGFDAQRLADQFKVGVCSSMGRAVDSSALFH